MTQGDLCGCIECQSEREEAFKKANSGISTNFGMIRGLRYACEKCGNKRCPHHTDHRLACTGSNEPGQKGSVYE